VAEQHEVLFFESNQRMEASDFEGAEQCLRQALAITHGFPEAWVNLGWLRAKAGAVDEAERHYRKAIAIQPDLLDPYLLLGVLLMDSRRFAEAEAVYRLALGLSPDLTAAWSNLGVLLACLKREGEAEECYRLALSLDSHYAKARFNLSYLLLRQGRFEEGWACFEARDWYGVLERYFTCPRWRGESLLGQSVLIGFEAGHGDMIQFCRYALLLKERGARWITVVCHPGLKALFKTLPAVDEVLSFADEVSPSAWHYWTPPLSLPYYCQTRLDSIPAPIPYVFADPAKLAKWSGLLPVTGLKVGLVWQGNPNFENDADRSLPSLELLAPLGRVAGVQFISLQKGKGEEEARHPPAGICLQVLADELEDFADTAAVITCLDLVIGVDTGVVHLAGALGKPCWVLLPDYRTDWRWLKDRTDSPWYPQTLRLFRQTQAGGWFSLIATVADALERWVKER